MSWQAELAEAARQAATRRGRVEPWWVKFETPADRIWCTTPESGEGWNLCAVARTLYGMGREFKVQRSSDERMALVKVRHPQEFLAVEESDMRLVMVAMRATGLHGTYRKAGTEKEYRF